MFKDILDSRQLTCYQLAKLCHVSYTAINEIYRGERTIEECTVFTAKKISSALGLTLDEFCHQCEQREKIPSELFPCFWDTDCKKLDLEKDKTYIITRLLSKGGYSGLAFIKKAYTYEEIKTVAKTSRNFSPKTASFLKNVYHLDEKEMAYFTHRVQDWRK